MEETKEQLLEKCITLGLPASSGDSVETLKMYLRAAEKDYDAEDQKALDKIFHELDKAKDAKPKGGINFLLGRLFNKPKMF